MKEAGDKRICIGILGFGNIGVGTYQLLEMNHSHIKETSGLDFEVVRILEKDVDRPRPVQVAPGLYTQDADSLLTAPDIDIVVELLGGIQPATDFMLKAMAAGKHVVTANKAAVAAHFPELRQAAIANRVLFRYEASVGGGIPILNALTTALTANRFIEVKGILNGTTNYILTRMAEAGLSYEESLAEAQAKGFAEADPTADVEGIDVANKLSILISLMFGERVAPEDIPTVGITGITPKAILDAAADNSRIKLIAHAKKTAAGIEYNINPMALPLSHPLASVSHEFNAIFVTGDGVGDLMFYGKGAGPLPTGSAVMGDIIEIGKAMAKNSAYDPVVPGGPLK